MYISSSACLLDSPARTRPAQNAGQAGTRPAARPPPPPSLPQILKNMEFGGGVVLMDRDFRHFSQAASPFPQIRSMIWGKAGKGVKHQPPHSTLR
jgi:hypothetical protein